MSTQNERHLQQQWQQYAEQQAQNISLSWSDVSSQKAAGRPRFYWLSAAALMLTVTLGWWLRHDFSPNNPLFTQEESHTPMLLAQNYQLDALDQRIQRAYVQGASNDEIAALWQQREQLTRSTTNFKEL